MSQPDSHSPVINCLLTRRSTKADVLTGPGPTSEQLETILRAGHRVPDHGKIGPWQFIVIAGDQRLTFGSVLQSAYAADHPEATGDDLARESVRFTRAPVVIAVLFRPRTNHPKVPVYEQLLSTGAACQNMLVAAHGMGLAGQWLTEWPATSEPVRQALGCGPDDLIAGFLYIGHTQEAPAERTRPVFEQVVTWHL